MSAPRIVIRTPNWLGDLMMSTAFINEALKLFPNAQIDLIVKKGLEDLPLPQRGTVHAFDKLSESAYAFGRRLRRYCYDRFYVLPPSFSSALMAYASKAKERIGYKDGCRGFLLNRSQAYFSEPRSQHLVTEYLSLLPDWNPASKPQPGLDITREWSEEILAKRSKPLPPSYICIAPGAIYGSAKQWPVEHFKTLVGLLNSGNVNSVIIGTKKDWSLGEYLTDQASDGTNLNLCGKTSLNELVAVLSLAEALVSNDSGTMHLMAALQKPQVAIFGSTSRTWTGPINEKADVIKLNMECSPCFKRECPLGHTNCLKQIVPEMVWEQLKPLLY